jgi:molybdopterin converting factor small subunit
MLVTGRRLIVSSLLMMANRTVMIKVNFTSNLRRHVDCPSLTCDGATVREVLNKAFERNERLRTYVLDDQNALRKHMSILVNGQAISDRKTQTDTVKPGDEIWVMQALSGG